MKEMTTRHQAQWTMRLHSLGIGVLLLLGVSWSVQAFEIKTDNPDVAIGWDNTIRYNYGYRMSGRNTKIGNTVYADEGDYLFNKHQAVTNRIDLLSEFDLVFKRNTGVRVSAALWFDEAYSGSSKSNPALAAIASYPGNNFTPTVKRFYAGPSGEFLDAFVFGKFDIGGMPINIKVGSHTIYWGESLLMGGAVHGISYSQSPLDLQKGFATPGAEVKELFRPLNNISGQVQVSERLSLEAQYFFDWAAARYPEGGTYLGPADFVFDGPVRQFAGGNIFLTRGNPMEPSKKNGEWGIAARFNPHWLDGTMGLYYRRYADKLPVVLRTGPAPSLTYNMVYGGDIDLWGISLAKQIAGLSIGAELSYRRNTPLVAPTLGVSPTGEMARGDTYHGLVNVVSILPKFAVFDTASVSAELTWSQWSKVRSHPELFSALGFAPCAGKEKWDGCATKNYVGLAVNFTPTWFQVLPGVDLSMPISASDGVSGNGATSLGGSERNGSYSIGIGADVQQKYRFDLKYNNYFGRLKESATAVTSQNGLSSLLQDRGYLVFTFKTSF